MVFEELYHGAKGDKILAIMREGVIHPGNGEICFGKFESEYPNLFNTGLIPHEARVSGLK